MALIFLFFTGLSYGFSLLEKKTYSLPDHSSPSRGIKDGEQGLVRTRKTLPGIQGPGQFSRSQTTPEHREILACTSTREYQLLDVLTILENEFSLCANRGFFLEGCIDVDSKVILLTMCISQGPSEKENQKYLYIHLYRERYVLLRNWLI